MAIALVVAVLAIAFGSSAPELAVAEFSPAARSALEAPPTTASEATSGAGGARPRAATSTTVLQSATTAPRDSSASAPTTRVGRGRSCYGDPPRQTEDPMSPTCLATIFEGDNGGATSRGVTATEIRVAVPASFGSGTSASALVQRGVVQALFERANQQFELYGRRLVPVFAPASTVMDAVASRALGAQMAADSVFGALTGYLERSAYPQVGLVQEMARQGIVTVTRNQASWWTDGGLFDASHPYVWSVYQSSEQLQSALAATACALAGQPARSALDPTLAVKTRRFGVISAGTQTPPSAGSVAAALLECTGQVPDRVDWSYSRDSYSMLPATVSRLREAGATTVICLCDRDFGYNVVETAHRAGYDPEWLAVPYESTDGDEWEVQYARAAGYPIPVQVQPGPRLLPLQARPWYRVLQAMSAAVLGDASTTRSAFQVAEALYDQVLLLASGIQGAGPTLTPHTFAQALMTMQFPNPGAGQEPYWQPSVGFGPGDHSFYDDFAIGWFSDSAPAVDPSAIKSTGSWCYVGAGARFRPAAVPANLDGMLYDANLACR